MNDHPNFLHELDELKSRLDKLERFPQPPSVLVSSLATTSFTLAAAGDALGGDLVLAYFTLHNANNQWLFAVPELTINQNVVDADGRWPFGNAWTTAQLRSLDITIFNTGDSAYRTHDQDVICYIFIRNRSATPVGSITVELYWRYQQLQGS